MTSPHTAFRPFARCLPILGIALLVAPLTSGCELFVHFDRSRIGATDSGPNVMDGGSDAATNDAGTDAGSDANTDANTPDTGMGDAGMDAGDDGGNDAGFDGGIDANRPDSGSDAGCVDPVLDCPDPGSECIVPMCSTGACATMNLGMSHVLGSGQTANDCSSVVCDGAGGTTTIADTADHAASTTCDTISCTGTTVTHTPALSGTSCTTGGGTVCDGAGACVQCVMASNCAAASCAGMIFHAAETCSGAHTCVAGSSTNCSGLGMVCNASAGCVECNGASDCAPASCVGTTFTPAQTCTGGHACASGGAPVDCSTITATPVCNATAGCVECNGTGDCTGGLSCNTTTHVCE
jgi:hypothetical protein